MGGDFLIRIKEALDRAGHIQTISRLKETQQVTQQLTKTKVTTIFDKEGLATGKQIEETFSGVAKEGKKSFQAMGDFEKALRRVIIVAPVWMAFRTVLQGTFALLREGFRTLEEFDRALIKAKAVVHDSTGSIDNDMIILEKTIRDFSKKSGIALKDLASAF